MCTLVDASPNTCGVFENANGLSIVRSVMNQQSTKGREPGAEETNVTAAKCFEFLLFYLQAQSFEEQAEQLAEPARSTSISLRPPTTPSAGRQAPRAPKLQLQLEPVPDPGPTPRARGHRNERVGGRSAHLENPFVARASAPDTPSTKRSPASPLRRTISPFKDSRYGVRPPAHGRRENGRW